MRAFAKKEYGSGHSGITAMRKYQPRERIEKLWQITKIKRNRKKGRQVTGRTARTEAGTVAGATARRSKRKQSRRLRV